MKLVVKYLSLPKIGEYESGDAVVIRHDEECSLLAVIDALGHGPLAAAVARTATDSLMAAPVTRGARPIVEQLHRDLHGSRGAAAMICTLRRGHIEGCGVGNVELRSFGAEIPAVLTPGILGRSALRLRLFEADVGSGSCLVLFSDGISARFDGSGLPRMEPGEGCRTLMDQHRRTHDDATVMIAQVQV